MCSRAWTQVKELFAKRENCRLTLNDTIVLDLDMPLENMAIEMPSPFMERESTSISQMEKVKFTPHLQTT
jgi:hypothetical protein